MGKKQKDTKSVVVKKEEKVKKCSHGVAEGELCDKCNEERQIFSNNIQNSMTTLQNTLLQMKNNGWTGLVYPQTNTLRLRHPVKKDSFYCPITGACVFTRNKSFGSTSVLKAWKVLKMKHGMKEIINGSDSGKTFLTKEIQSLESLDPSTEVLYQIESKKNALSFRNFLEEVFLNVE